MFKFIMQTKAYTSLILSILLSLTLGMPLAAQANSGGGDAGGGLTVKLEPFTVNLSSFERFLQVSVTLQVGNPEMAEKIKASLPVVRHGLIMILSDKEASQLQSVQGKRELMEEIMHKLNKVLGGKEHEGVTDIFFENFIIQ